MYLWLLEMRRPQYRHEKEIKADRLGNNNSIQCTQPTALRFRKCSALPCDIGRVRTAYVWVFVSTSCVFSWSELSLLPFTMLSKLRVSTANTNMSTDTNTLAYQPFCSWQGPSPFSLDCHCRKSCLSPPSESTHRTCVGIGHH